MPIIYNEERKAWEFENGTAAEKESLVAIAREFIVTTFGQEVAERIVGSFFAQEALENYPEGDMYQA